MLDTEGLITKIREILEEKTSIVKTYSPDLPQESENILAVTLLSGTQDYNLCGNDYFYPIIRTLIRGTSNDTETRHLVDEVYNTLNLKEGVVFNSSKITQILASTLPTFVGKDNNQRNLYNITFNLKVKGE